jgi:hypothetical protein
MLHCTAQCIGWGIIASRAVPDASNRVTMKLALP